MNKDQIEQLLLNYANGATSKKENALLEDWYLQFRREEYPDLSEDQIQHYLSQISMDVPIVATKAYPKSKKLWPRIAVAAAIFAIVFGIALYYSNQYQGISEGSHYANDIAPGKQGATLTLASGKKIRLSDAANGVLAKEAGVSISKSSGGQLLYEIAPQEPNNERGGRMNTLSTAKGETYQVRLPDGSLVYLNAASSLTFSANLNVNGKRKVKLDGEGYFEIVKDKAHPFIVESRGQQVEVLGTHFNINSYQDELTEKTTLLEGSVKVISAGLNHTLKPGQQAIQAAGKVSIEEINARDAVDWKNGEFICRNEPLGSIMKKIARWYDVEVVYMNPDLKNRTFSGSLSRYDHVRDVLRALGFVGTLKFKLENRTIQVL